MSHTHTIAAHFLFCCLALATIILAASGCESSGDDVPPQKRMAAEPAQPEAKEKQSAGAAELAAGTQPGEPVADWCHGHGLPESKCTKCNPELTEDFKASGDWCQEHELPESACPICNPQTQPAESGGSRQGSADDWCVEHALPESMCTKCNPELKAGFVESGDWCAGHDLPESACPDCHPMTPPAGVAPAKGESL